MPRRVVFRAGQNVGGRAGRGRGRRPARNVLRRVSAAVFLRDARAADAFCRAVLRERAGGGRAARLRAAHPRRHRGGTDMGEEAALEAEEEFKRVFQQRALPTDIPEYAMDAPTEPIFVPQFCTDAGLTASNGEARRSIKAGAFKVNGEKYTEENLTLEDGMIVQVGKRKFVKIKFN